MRRGNLALPEMPSIFHEDRLTAVSQPLDRGLLGCSCAYPIMIELRCLGSLSLQRSDGAPLDRVMAQPKRMAFLSYLAAATPHGFFRRDALLALFWPELDQEHARAALRNTLHFLRGELDSGAIITRGDDVAVCDALMSCDVWEFEACLQQRSLEGAVAVYRGDLLSGLHLSAAPDFERWLDAERTRLRRMVHTAVKERAGAESRAGNFRQAEHWLRTALALCPDDEVTLQCLIRVLDQEGDRAGALREYEVFAQRMVAEFEVQPSPESHALVDDIRNRAGATRTAGLNGAPATDRAGRVKSILVLPFVNISSDSENEYFVDGLTDELITDLSQVHSLRVISRTSAMRLKHSGKDLKAIARELEVQYVLEGSVRRIGNNLRIATQLIDSASETPVWADKYAGSIEDVFRIQEILSRKIVHALEITLTPEESQRLRERKVDNPHAYECYLKARAQIWLFSPAALDQAIHLIDNALAIVGDDPLLYATKAYVTAHYIHSGGTVGEGYLDRAQECVAKAFVLAPDSYHGHLARGLLLHIKGDFQGAVRDLKKVLSVDPNNPDSLAMLGYIYALCGQEAASKPLHARLLEVDPLTPLNYAFAGFVSFLEGHPERTLDPYRKYHELAGDDPAADWFYAWSLAINRRTAEMDALLNRVFTRAPNSVFALFGKLMSHAAHGHRERTLASLTPELRECALGAELFSRELAHFLALVGENEQAISWIENANRLGLINYPFLAEHDRLLDNIRSEPRFQRLLVRVKEQWIAFEP
jgi:TolB-like protein/Flp pilus assembly protein TadD